MKNQERKELTYAQKLALDGEIAYAIATSNHDDEVLYRMYSVLVTIPKELYSFVLDAFERLSDISQEKIDRVRAEIALGKVPLWIWENKCVGDLKECIKYSGQALNQSSVTANQKALRRKLVESAFVFFVRKTSMLAVKPAYDLCVRILQEPGLEQLEKACTYLINELDEFPIKDKIPKDTLMKIMESNFDLRETLSLKLELKAIDMLDEQIKKENKKIQTEKSISHDIENEIAKTFMQLVDEGKEASEIEKVLNAALNCESTESAGYVVKKIFNGSLKATTLETFETRKEAEEFIKNILTNMPELSQTCTFIIEHQIK